jgi:bacterioferritin
MMARTDESGTRRDVRTATAVSDHRPGRDAMDRQRSIDRLNRAVADELAAVLQYMYFHFHLDDQGFGPLAGLFKRTAIEEMGHIERLSERILFLKGDVTLVPGEPPQQITDPERILARAAAMEESSVLDYNDAARDCAANADAQSRQLFESLIGDEERHLNQYEREKDNIRRFGPSYLALQAMQGASEPPAEPKA